MPEPLFQTLEDIAGFLRDNKVPFALIGGLAAAIRGEPRATLDVDLVIKCDVESCLALVDRLNDSLFAPLFEGVAEVVETAFILPLKHRHTSVKVDLALGMTGFEQNAIRNASAVDIGGCSIPVVTAEDLMLMKTLAARPRDTDDVERIVLRQGEALNWDYVMEKARQLEEAIGKDLVEPLKALRESRDA